MIVPDPVGSFIAPGELVFALSVIVSPGFYCVFSRLCRPMIRPEPVVMAYIISHVNELDNKLISWDACLAARSGAA